MLLNTFKCVFEKKKLLIICLLDMYWHFGLALSGFRGFFKQHLNTCINADMFLLMFTLMQECFKVQNEIQAPLISMADSHWL